MKKLIKYLASVIGIGVTNSNRLALLEQTADSGPQLMELMMQALGLQKNSKSQMGPDLIALLSANLKRGAYFVEFGATNGVDLSNSFLLEKDYGWEGILAEPAHCWHADLRKNRSAAIDTDCVWTSSGQTLNFNMVPDAELSTIDSFSASDKHQEERRHGVRYPVNTISLLDLLRRHGAPKYIDYLSIDTEGSEFKILSAFDFDEYHFGFISCEHNYTADRERIHGLLTKYGYVRRMAGLSKWDDWYFSERVGPH